MVDFNQGLDSAEAFHRCHMIDDLGLDWIEEPIVYDNFDGFARLSAELKTPIQIGENFYGFCDLYRALQMKACDLVMPDFIASVASLGGSERRRWPERRAFLSLLTFTLKSPPRSCASRRQRIGSNGRTGPILSATAV